MSRVIDQDGTPVRVLAIGEMHYSPHVEECGSIREAISAGGWACEYNTWAIDRIEVDGRTVMERDEILERFDQGRYDDLPDIGLYRHELPAVSSAPLELPAPQREGDCP